MMRVSQADSPLLVATMREVMLFAVEMRGYIWR